MAAGGFGEWDGVDQIRSFLNPGTRKSKHEKPETFNVSLKTLRRHNTVEPQSLQFKAFAILKPPNLDRSLNALIELWYLKKPYTSNPERTLKETPIRAFLEGVQAAVAASSFGC